MLSDLMFAFRQFRKSPGVTAALVAPLGVGIGCVTVVLCWIQGILLKPVRGVENQGSLVVLVSNQGSGNISLLDAREFNNLRDAFQGVAVSQVTPASLTVSHQTEWSYGQITTANFFSLLGLQPMLGRTFLPQEDLHPGGDAVLVIGERLWRRRFRADPNIIGRTVELNKHPFTIIGVVPEVFRGTMVGLACEFWAPISMNAVVTTRGADSLTSRSSRGFHNVVRLRDGVTLAQAQAIVAGQDLQLEAAYGNSNREVRHRVLRYRDCPYGAQALLSPVLPLLLAVSFGVLLIVIANVANLQLARAATRHREIAVRLAAGSSRWQLIRLLLLENLVLVSVGGAAGVLLAAWGVGGLKALLPETNLPVGLDLQLEPAVLLMTGGVTLLTGFLVGIVPALQCSRAELYDTLKQSGRSIAGSRQHHRLRALLVVAEMALAVVLLIGAALCVQALNRAKKVDLGVEPRGVLIAGLQIGMHGYNQETGRAFYRELQQRLLAAPGVEDAALASWLPLGFEGCKGHGVTVKGYVRRPGENPTFEYSIVSPHYFSVVKTSFVAGRDFTKLDDRDHARVAIVNEAFAEKFWPGTNPIGQVFRAGGEERAVVGVVKTGKYNRLREPAHPFFFVPYEQYVPDLDLRIVVRAQGDPLSTVGTVRTIVQQIDPNVALYGTMPMTSHVEASMFAQNVATNLVTALGGVALVLAAMGVYSVMSYAVAQRVPEFGIRLALGAQESQLVWEVQRQGLLLSGAAVLIGVVLALVCMSALAGILYGVKPLDAGVYLTVPVLLAVVSALACWLPARRASRLDPMVVLRDE